MLYGRDVERDEIGALLANARASRSGALVLRGEPGIGKTALLVDARDRAGDMHVLSARGVESEAELAFAGLHQLFHPVLGVIEQLPAPQASALRGALGLAERAAVDRFLVSAACLTLLSELGERQPVLCLIDDAQWLDEASAQALLFVARRLEAEPVALLFAAREGDERRFDAPEVRSMPVEGLDRDASTKLLDQRAGDGLAESVRNRLVDEAGGNALALLELPVTLTAAQLAGREPLVEPLPLGARLQGAYLSRVRRLPQPTQTLLLLAAGEDSGELNTILRAAASAGVDDDALGAAERDGLVRVVVSTLYFRHPLVRSAVYQGATFKERQTAHRRLADAQVGGNEDRRAWHLAAAASGPDETIAEALDASAARAIERGGHGAAAAAFERAALLSTDEAARTRRLLGAAEATWLAGKTERARDLVAGLAAVAPPDARVDVMRLRGNIEVRSGVFADALSMLVSAADALADTDPETSVRLLLDAEEATLYTGDLEAPVRIGALADQIAERADDESIVAEAAVLIGIGHLHAGRFEAAAPFLRDALTRGAASDDIDQILLAARVGSVLAEEQRSRDLTARALRIAREQGAIGAVPRILERLAYYEYRLGRYPSARAHATEGLALARDTGQETGVLLCELALVAGIQGREDECHACAAEAMERARERQGGLLAAMATWAIGLLDLGGGRPEAAMVRFASALAPDAALTHRVIALQLTPDYIESATRANQLEAAQQAMVVFEQWAIAVGQEWALGLLSHCRGLMANSSEAEAHFAEALRLHELAGRPFEHARTRLALGESLRRARKRREAREHLREALHAFEQLEIPPWEERARAELRASGETARRRDPSTLSHLTPQELQVARLVGEGFSNKEVAAQLFLSPRTIDAHLRNVFAKLEITSRTQLMRMPFGSGEGAAVPVAT